MLTTSARIFTIAWKLQDASLIGCRGPAQSTNVIIRFLNRKYQTCFYTIGGRLDESVSSSAGQGLDL